MSNLSENCNTAEHHRFLHVWTTSKPAQQGHRPPCRKTARQRACQPPCPRTGQTPATTCTTGSSTPKQLRDNNGHRPPQRATPRKPRARQQPCPRTARRHPPPPHPLHHPGTHFGAPGRRPRRCNNDRRIALYRALGSAGACHSPEGGDTGRTSYPVLAFYIFIFLTFFVHFFIF